ncbi:MAG: O-antigen ligase family protein [Planctomyces sp.]|nr:O-antigen ligase family protein [Planctomyces sp.]
MMGPIRGLAIALITAGLLWPVEEAVSGAGLQWVVLWMVLGMLVSFRGIPFPWPTWQGLRALTPVAFADAGCLCIVFGQLLSTCFVFQRGGDCRAAINLCCEWVGLLFAWWILRASLTAESARRDLGIAVVGVMTGIAAFGLWQHHVIYQQQSNWYQTLRKELDENQGSAGSVLRVSEILREFQENEIPLEGSERVLWENRLLNSSEPTGTFALANTFSGLLAVAILIAAGAVIEVIPKFRTLRLHQIAGLIICVLVLSYAMVLTKSRTAWVGLSVGALYLLFNDRRGVLTVRVRKAIFIAVLLTGSTAGAAIVTGALDKEVILEAPRSLQYRLFYWMGTMGVLRENPWTGAGPGNFRQAYLQHKPAESSEEIRDPHNWILDAWVSGGMLSFAGVLLLLSAATRLMVSGATDAAEETTTPSEVSQGRVSSVRGRTRVRAGRSLPSPTSALKTGLVLGFLLHAGWLFLNGRSVWGDNYEQLWIPAALGIAILTGGLNSIVLNRKVAVAGLIAMSVHLLGAGGFQMPAPMLFLLLCLAVAVAPAGVTPDGVSEAEQRGVASEAMGHTEWRRIGLGAGFSFVGVVVVVFAGLLPVSRCEAEVSIGKYYFSRGRLDDALEQFRSAAESDPISVISRQRIVEVLSYRLSKLADRVDGGVTATRLEGDDLKKAEKLREEALQACEALIGVDQRNTLGYRYRSSCEKSSFRITGDTNQLKNSVESMKTVVRLYPTSVSDLRVLAETQALSGESKMLEEASTTAGRALELDELNRTWGHTDLYLTDEQRKSLSEILQHRAVEPYNHR